VQTPTGEEGQLYWFYPRRKADCLSLRPRFEEGHLELGGNCPFIIFDDANLDQALNQLMALKWRHAGQACITANRIYVQAGVYDKVAQLLKERTSKLVVGHGAAKDTTMGPVTTPRSLDKASSQVEDARKLGANVILGGNRISDKGGYFFEPTIITGMTKDMLISREETFAPIAALYKFETEEEAVKLANDTSMGLASYAFTKNIDRMWRMLENLEAGMIGMNTGGWTWHFSLSHYASSPESRPLANDQ
jgi:NAD-dependent aldehyde dehydrogenases